MHLPTEIENPVTGERIAFDESASDGERLVWEEFIGTVVTIYR